MNNTTTDVPPELQSFASFLDAQLREVQEAVKFELLNVTEVDGGWHYTFSGAGEVFSVVRDALG